MTVATQAHLDARWLMSYMACVAEVDTAYFDSDQAYAAHPLFPVCVEWPAILKLRAVEQNGSATQSRGGVVHASHDLHIFKPFPVDATVSTSASLIGRVQKSPGVYETLQLDTRDSNGALLCTTYQGSMCLGEQLNGLEQMIQSAPEIPVLENLPVSREYALSISAGLAHIYTECAKIYNPIHTDRSAARKAGLPDILLHGTATLALAVSKVVEQELEGNFGRVNRIAARFSGMVFMPAQLRVQIKAKDEAGIAFEVLNTASEKLISGGYIGYHRNAT